ncbi:uncharacterized protein JCM6883_000126 [Sporobolomyces salmoneus]|uniref:uncharacterized protein n=1 Tax=Sporobolomyces salmoneus TaxID=183962 RepID=UPI003179FBF0
MQCGSIRARTAFKVTAPWRKSPPPRSLSLSRTYSTSTSPIQAAAQRRIARIDATTSSSASSTPFLTDSFGRRHDYLRISLTEKCNLRCTYCMPSDGVPLLPRDDLLTTDEIERTAKLFVQNGVKKIRLTGGEPTVRKDLVDVVARLSALKPRIESLGITSNGVTLRRHLPALVDAGLTHLNLSLDTLDEHKYELMTRRRAFSKVMETLEVAKELRDKKGLRVKLNCVVIKGLNDMEVPDFVELAKTEDLTIRFIEYMPFEKNRWSTSKLVPSSELLSRVQLRNLESPIDKLQDSASDTTRAYRVRGHKGSFGFISSMTDHFCGTCSRLRVGADGGVKVCLFGPPALSLRPLLRSLPSTPENDLIISREIGKAVWGKKFAHDGLGGMLGIQKNGKMGSMVGIVFRTRRVEPRRRHSKRLQSPLVASTNVTHLLKTLPPSRTPTTSLRFFSTSPSTSSSESPRPPPTLSHIDPRSGKASMVDVSPKEITLRTATAKGKIYLNEAAFSLIDFGSTSPSSSSTSSSSNTLSPPPTTTTTMQTKKGDVLSISQLAGLMAAKQTSSLIPLCHPLSLSHLSVTLVPNESDHSIEITCRATCEGKTGVEMEALMGVSVAGLTVWDMTKAVAGEEMVLGDIRVVEKTGGRSGDWKRN